MIIEECNLPHLNPFVNDYINGNPVAEQLFDYRFHERTAYIKRIEDLQSQTYPRTALVDHLHAFNEMYCTHPKVFENIRKLESKESAVVITGQQAGLLTGPLYTIYKAISAIQLANQLEQNLKIPIVPVFWVAGEDHDYQEINHVWSVDNGVLKKLMLKQKQFDKRPISKMTIDRDLFNDWVRQVFESFGESDKTLELLQLIDEKIQKSDSFSALFIHIMAELFQNYGLVFIDSSCERLRKIEAPFFEKLIKRNNALQSAFQMQKEMIRSMGYASFIDTDDHCAHLFYHLNGERILLYRNEEGTYADKNDLVQFDERELLDICHKRPETLSNNVVTRPLMQDYLFPTLAFVAGPGEIAYWSHLKSCFHLFDRKMPPVVPRMHVTVVERHIKKTMERFGLHLDEVVGNGVESFKTEWLESRQNHEFYNVIDEVKHAIDLSHAKIRKLAWKMDQNLGELAEKNRLHLFAQIDFMKRRFEHTFQERYAQELSALNEVEAALYPNKGWQERSWNVFYYLNKYGLDFIDTLFKIPAAKYGHYILFL